MLDVFANKKEAGILGYNEKDNEFIFNYTENNPISLTMPYQLKSYVSKYKLHPIFDMNMPEGYLFSLLKNLLIKKYGKINDFIMLKHLSSSIEGYLSYKNNHQDADTIFTLDEILNDNSEDLFSKLIQKFLNKSAISGVQPKVLTLLKDKVNLSSKEYIIKSFFKEYPHLAENEYFCMKAIRYAGIKTPKFWLSENKKFFIIEKFTYMKDTNKFYGFEEFCVLFGLNKEQKYNGSYEKITKAIFKISTKFEIDLRTFFKMIVMSYLLKNGDAHLKNFGILYDSTMENRFLAPAYDVVNTVIYLAKDKPALSLFGKKIWLNKKTLLQFGEEYCFLDKKEAEIEFNICINAIKLIKEEVKTYIKITPSFKQFGNKFLNILEFSLNENLHKSYKEIPNGVL
jgi:serine/threonine-protein kinase HipA